MVPTRGNVAPVDRSLTQDEDEDEDDEEDDDEGYQEGGVPQAAMSESLMRALGIPITNPISTDWRPPARPGLDNSAPIVPMPKDNRSRHNEDRITTHSQDVYYNTQQEVDEDEEEEDDEDGDEDDDEEEEDVVHSIPRGAMSLSLMRALGLDTTGLDVPTDWRPPSAPGLSNSSPLARLS